MNYFLFLQLHQTLTDMKYFNVFAVEYQLLDIFLIFYAVFLEIIPSRATRVNN